MVFLRALAGLALVAFLAAPAAAQTLCGDREHVLASLAESYEEVHVARGLSANGSLMEIFASPTGSWTVLMSQPDGKTCTVAVGEMWQVEANGADLSGQCRGDNCI